MQRNRGKIGRNEACPCGSGKKHKRCHGSIDGTVSAGPPRLIEIPDIIQQRVIAHQLKSSAFEAEHGKGRPIVTAEFKEWRFVAVGNELHYSRKEKTKFFADFLSNYLRNL